MLRRGKRETRNLKLKTGGLFVDEPEEDPKIIHKQAKQSAIMFANMIAESGDDKLSSFIFQMIEN